MVRKRNTLAQVIMYKITPIEAIAWNCCLPITSFSRAWRRADAISMGGSNNHCSDIRGGSYHSTFTSFQISVPEAHCAINKYFEYLQSITILCLIEDG